MTNQFNLIIFHLRQLNGCQSKHSTAFTTVLTTNFTSLNFHRRFHNFLPTKTIIYRSWNPVLPNQAIYSLAYLFQLVFYKISLILTGSFESQLTKLSSLVMERARVVGWEWHSSNHMWEGLTCGHVNWRQRFASGFSWSGWNLFHAKFKLYTSIFSAFRFRTLLLRFPVIQHCGVGESHQSAY